MQKSLFSKYYSICVMMILVSIALIGSVFLILTSNYFEQEKYDLLSRNVKQAVSITMEDLSVNDYDYVSAFRVLNVYTILGDAIDADIFLVDVNGKTLLCTETSGCNHSLYSVDEDVMSQVIRGEYHNVGHLGSIYSTPHYIVGVPLTTPNGSVVGAVFAASSAESLTQFVTDTLQMFALSALVALIVVFICVYYITGRMVRPIRQMVAATESFSKGDFSARVPVGDFDELGKLAMAFNNMASSMTTMESTRRSFIANVSHELKTPMTTIGGFIDGILDGTIPPDRERHYLEIVSAEVKRLSRLVRSMLDVAKIEAGEMKIELAPVDINDVILRTVFTFEQRIEDRHLDIRGLEADRVMVLADVDLIHQVVYNLIDNAVKFVNDGGYIEFSYDVQDDLTYIGVKNSGAGLSKEEVAHVFDRFYKTDKSRSMDKMGVGLGLSIVRTVINMHSGEIIVRSVEGEYCEFQFTLKTANARNSQNLLKNEKEKNRPQSE